MICCKSGRSGRHCAAMILRAFVVSLLIAAVPTTALAGALDQGHCRMKDMPMQHSSGGMDHSMHAGHVMDTTASADDSVRVQASKAASGCKCGCNCANNHCASSFSGFLSADLGRTLADSFTERHPRPFMVAHVSAAHHLDLIRPPAQT